MMGSNPMVICPMVICPMVICPMVICATHAGRQDEQGGDSGQLEHDDRLSLSEILDKVDFIRISTITDYGGMAVDEHDEL
ncbi:hypothetical protein NHX12_031374 [Muraenolepis orangiensis]|uniref:Uncharacterized protein n=1 Tax=Muraenolepis orangiensis TaxID=630683 RepID=A0A9Q0E5H8_9TELE|nr:hypothetical protein NHX12_031374 [Muraenolepis orangiensis]